MQANVGDHIHMNGKTGEIQGVRGSDGGPPYDVRWEDGHEQLVHPGPDTEVVSRAAERE